MPTLAVISTNPIADSIVSWIGIGTLTLLGLMLVGLWIALAGGIARNDDSDDSEGAEPLRRLRLITRRRRRGPRGAAVVTEMQLVEAPEPAPEPAAEPVTGPAVAEAAPALPATATEAAEPAPLETPAAAAAH